MEQVGQSPMIGEVAAGILLGPSILGVIDPNPALQPGASLAVVSQLGILVLVLLAGMELGREGLRKALKEKSIYVAFVEFVLPFALGYSLALALGMNFPQCLFLGTALAVTALPVSVRILMDLNLLHSRIGRAIVSVALANDLVAFAMLGLILEVSRLGATALDPGIFGFVGLNFSLSFGAWPVIVLVTAVAFFGKLFGGILGGLFAGFRGRPLLALGVGLNARGMMELLLAQVGLATGLIGADLYSALIVMALVTTLSTPPLMKRLVRGFTAKDVLPEIALQAKEPGGRSEEHTSEI